MNEEQKKEFDKMFKDVFGWIKLKEVIQKANPEIMELKFGCKIIWKPSEEECLKDKEGSHHRHYTITRDDLTQGDAVLGQSTCKIIKVMEEDFADTSYRTLYNDDIVKEKGYTILGRPITLADVLLALSKAKLDYEYWVTSDGHFYHTEREDGDGNHEISPTGEYYNLKEDLDNQLDETKQFLINLLIK